MADFDAGTTAQAGMSGAAAGSVAGPWGAVIGAGVGIGVSLLGQSKSAEAAKQSTEAQKAMIALEQKIEAQKRQAMELDANRKQIENTRNIQRARALALTNATSQGAGQGSGLQGGYGQIAGQGAWNSLGIAQNLQIGRNIFDVNAQISQQKIAMANAGLLSQQGAAYTSTGNQILSASGSIGKVFSGFGNEPNAKPTNVGSATSTEGTDWNSGTSYAY